jgi:hydrogenase expression/formation protein HypD
VKYIEEFRDRRIVKKLALALEKAVDPRRTYGIMEVCGTHTMSIFRFGLRDMLPPNIRLISGPGCPVCVTPNSFLDKAMALARLKGLIITTFGDMARVPGSSSSLEKERAAGRDVRIVYSCMDAVRIAVKNPQKEVVFLGVGFETTAPTVAQSIVTAKKDGIRNYSVLCGHKTIPEALKVLAEDKELKIDAFILPGHVSTIIGAKPYEFLSRAYGKRGVVAGFEPVDILEAMLMLVKQRKPAIEIQYSRIAGRAGNVLAKRLLGEVFEKTQAAWRGIGTVRDSGYRIRKNFSSFDAETKFAPKIKPPREEKRCICGDVLKGIKIPPDCPLFAKVCNPSEPVGACMVSSEGTCAAYYKYSS